ncbi:hypothetical protein SAMN04487965_2549 [Microbulbifer donghaiensis]|uniref:Uncharacterized protein n=1 Tax=Microbulbifer donghaiensis TaxID=494016 RepID=A0A1M5E011_9GAMM|nr:hypothetical protein [Microbulbifer donghaiensis]SHF72583.1 hypothetical protein SAMN04487965_2549 [Microbulbifer donghaiensis]
MRAQILYLLNFLLLPGIAFILLLVLWYRTDPVAASLQRQHLASAIKWALIGGGLLVIVPLAYIVLTAGKSTTAIALLVTAWVCIHGLLVLIGAHGLMRAASNRPPAF